MYTKKQRIAAISALLAQNPNRLYSLEYFQKLFGAAKSSISEDIAVLRQSLEELGGGKLQTVAGPHGGVRLLPVMPLQAKDRLCDELIREMSDSSRILPGGFIYLADLFYTPRFADGMAQMMAEWFYGTKADLVATIETKGIPLAMGVARLLNLPVAIARRDVKPTDGPVFSINYLSGSSRRLQTMSLSRRMVREGARAVVIDDFISGGGTLKALCGLLAEFKIEVEGIGVAIVNKYPQKKKIKQFQALFLLEELSESHIDLISYK
ncbi:pur operon repressor [Christensenellaceae bacterium OttesenSCG-928-K19]|nr:pur operon repressor [Christensenellaceae bacterium OttesenSCG-928-K19]